MIGFNDGSLYNGCAGAALINFILSRKLNSSRHLKKAKSEFNEAANILSESNDFSFNKGLLGLGWLSEYLVQNQYLALKTSAFLEDLDDIVYRMVLSNSIKNISINDGMYSVILYYYKRLTSKESNTKFYRDVCNKECLTIVIDMLFDYYNVNQIMINSSNNELAQLIVLLPKLLKLGINRSQVKKLICKVSLHMNEKIQNFKPSHTSTKDETILLKSWLNMGEVLEIKNWITLAKTALKTSQTKFTDLFELESSMVLNKLVTIDRANKYNWKEAWLIV